MPTDTINFNTVTSATFDGTSLSEITFNGTQAWVAPQVITVGTASNYNISAHASAAALAGTQPIIINVTGAVTSSNSNTPAMRTGTGWTSGASITIVNTGSISGASGSAGSNGLDNSSSTGAAGNGGQGADGGGAFNVGPIGSNGSGGAQGPQGGNATRGGSGGTGFANEDSSNVTVSFSTAGTVQGGGVGSNGIPGGGGNPGLGGGGGGGGGAGGEVHQGSAGSGGLGGGGRASAGSGGNGSGDTTTGREGIFDEGGTDACNFDEPETENCFYTGNGGQGGAIGSPGNDGFASGLQCQSRTSCADKINNGGMGGSAGPPGSQGNPGNLTGAVPSNGAKFTGTVTGL